MNKERHVRLMCWFFLGPIRRKTRKQSGNCLNSCKGPESSCLCIWNYHSRAAVCTGIRLPKVRLSLCFRILEVQVPPSEKFRRGKVNRFPSCRTSHNNRHCESLSRSLLSKEPSKGPLKESISQKTMAPNHLMLAQRALVLKSDKLEFEFGLFLIPLYLRLCRRTPGKSTYLTGLVLGT